MDSLSDRELRSLVAAIRILDEENGPPFPRRAVAAARALVACDLAGYYDLSAQSEWVMLSLDPEPADPASVDLGSPNINYHQLAISAGDHEYALLVLQRANVDFGESEKALLAALSPHLAARRRSFEQLCKLKRDLGLPNPDEEDCCGPRLSAREMQVMIWVVQGKTNEEVAAILGTSPLTVKKHLEHVFEKLQVSNRTSAALCFAACRQAAARAMPPDSPQREPVAAAPAR